MKSREKKLHTFHSRVSVFLIVRVIAGGERNSTTSETFDVYSFSSIMYLTQSKAFSSKKESIGITFIFRKRRASNVALYLNFLLRPKQYSVIHVYLLCDRPQPSPVSDQRLLEV